MRLLLLLLTLCVLPVVPALAQNTDYGPAIELAQNGGMTLAQAVESVRRQTDGRIISAETKSKNGNEVHHIKVLSKDGKVKTYKIQGRKSDRG